MNNRKSISKDEITDITMHVDEYAETDEDFFESFTKGIFELFDWTYYTKETDEEIESQIDNHVNKQEWK